MGYPYSITCGMRLNCCVKQLCQSHTCDPLQSFADTCWAEPTIVGQLMLWCHKPKSGMPQFRMPDLTHMPLLRVTKLTPRQWTINRSYEGQAGVDQGRRPEAAEAGGRSREAAEAGGRSREAGFSMLQKSSRPQSITTSLGLAVDF